MGINYNDSRLTQVEQDKAEALNRVDENYGKMIEESDKYYEGLVEQSKSWAETQAQNQQKQTDFAIAQMEQQKEQAKKEYIKEQSGAYTDWKKQSNEYGAEAEKMAAAGLQNSGYSETAQVNYYNTYQNRVASAKQSFDQIVLNTNTAMENARLQNSAALAEIYAQAQQEQLSLLLQGFEYKNSLILQQEETRQAYDNIYYQRYLDVLDQLNAEAALAEQIRQANMSYAYKAQQKRDSAMSKLINRATNIANSIRTGFESNSVPWIDGNWASEIMRFTGMTMDEVRGLFQGGKT